MNDPSYEELLARLAKGDTPPPGCALKPGTVSSAMPISVASGMQVMIDGDTTPTPVLSLIYTVDRGARVMVLFWPPHGAYVIGIINDAPWIAPSFAAGWANVGVNQQVVEYRRDGHWVSLRGIATRTSGVASLIFTLPDGYRPAFIEGWAVTASSQEHGEVTVKPTGEVEFFPSSTSGASYVSLTGLRFWANA